MKKEKVLLEELEGRADEFKESENKNRKKVRKWLETITEIIERIGTDMWGDSNYYTVDIPGTNLFLRYKECSIFENRKETGFFKQNSNFEVPRYIWGDDLKYRPGDEFWDAYQEIVEWLPKVIHEMEEKSEERQSLLEKINL